MSERLLRVLGRRDVLAIAFGAIIGWSWVLLTGEWVARAGPLGAVLAFAIGGLAMLLIGLCYAELASAMPRAGGEHVYTLRAFGPGVSFVCTWALLLAYVTVVAFEAVAIATGIEYLFPAFTRGFLWEFAGGAVWATWAVAGMSIAALLTWVNVRGVRPAAVIQTIVTGVIVFAGIVFLSGVLPAGNAANLQPMFGAGVTGMLSVLIMVPMMFIGFDVIPQAAEEIDLPAQRIGALLVLAVWLALLWYVAMIFGVAWIFPAGELGAQRMATADAASRGWGAAWAGQLVVLGGIAGILSSWNAFLVGGSRLLYALARDGLLPGWLADLHPRYRTPWKAVLLIGAFAFVAPLFGRQILVWCIDAGGFAVIIAYGLVAAAFLRLRRREPAMERPYRLRFGPAIGVSALCLSLGLLFVYLPGSPAALIWPYEWAILLGWSLLGLAFWAAGRRGRKHTR